jgi:hypothetical protein
VLIFSVKDPLDVGLELPHEVLQLGVWRKGVLQDAKLLQDGQFATSFLVLLSFCQDGFRDSTVVGRNENGLPTTFRKK